MAYINEQTANGSERTFMLKLYDDYGRLMYFIAKKCCSDPFAREEIVQDTLLKLIEKSARLRNLEEKALAAYISVSVRNTAYSHLRRRAKEQELFVPWNEAIPFLSLETPSIEETLTTLEVKGDFMEAWTDLSAEEQFLLEGRYILRYTDRELSENLGCKPDSIRMKLTRVRRKVLKKMKERDREGDDKNEVPR